jgi:hypothetical protein
MAQTFTMFISAFFSVKHVPENEFFIVKRALETVIL